MEIQTVTSAWFDLESSVDPIIFISAFSCTVLACVAIQFGPARIHAYCAIPFIPALLACLFTATTRPELYVTSCMLACPLMLWAGRPKRVDSMREILTDSAQSSPGSKASR